MKLEDLIETMPTWGLSASVDATQEFFVAPLGAFREQWPELTLTVIPQSLVPEGRPYGRAHIRENEQSFDVVYHQFESYHGLWHERGANWILWSDDLKHVFISEGQQRRQRTWVHARFILRHFIVARLLGRPGWRRIHAVAGPLVGQSDQRGLLIAGPYLSGKTFLLQSLIARGIVSELVEDDCAVIDANWRLASLIPQEKELCRLRHLDIRAVICLDQQTRAIEVIAPPTAAQWAFGLSASWPLFWLPGAPLVNASVAHVPSHLICLRVPERPDIEAVSEAIANVLQKIW